MDQLLDRNYFIYYILGGKSHTILRASVPEGRANVATNEYKKAFTDLLETYVSLDESAETIVRQLKKTANAELRVKLVQELRNLEKRRLELLDQLDGLAKST